MTINRLPTFCNYVVDIRLKQFRKITGGTCEFIDFESQKGKDLLKKIKRKGFDSKIKRLK